MVFRRLSLLLALLLGGTLLAWWGPYLRLDYLQQQHGALQAAYAAAPWRVALSYVALYVLVAALALPGAALLTVAGGAVFGFGTGLLLASFASSLGASLSFLAARHLLRDLVARRFSSVFQAVDRGVARDGAFYLLSLRLVPLVPFFAINLVMGLTRMPVVRFYLVSQLGMLAGTAVYVNAGTQLATLQALADLLSPRVMGALALLAAMPWLARALQDRWQRHRLYRPWAGRRPRRFDRNLIVIGAGAGGLVTAYIGAAARAQVTLVESGAMGGDCLNHGCVPSKALIRCAKAAHAARQSAQWGVQAQAVTVDFAAVMRRVQAVVEQIAPHDSVERYRGLGVDVVIGRARLLDPWTVEVALADGGVTRLSAPHVVVATGARPVVPALPGLSTVVHHTSETLWQALAQWQTPPPHLLVLGGGAMGCELAQALARLGCGVTLIERQPRVLPQEDEDVSALALHALQASGVRVLLGTEAVRCERDADGDWLLVSSAASSAPPALAPAAGQGPWQRLPSTLIVCALGRQARLEGLEALGLATWQQGRFLATNAYLQTSLPNLYAVGDVNGRRQLTHAAGHQAWYAAVNALLAGWKRFAVDERVLPHTVFLDPEIARVGLNERQAQAEGIAYECTCYPLAELDRAIADGATQGFVKLLTAPGSDRILGVTIVGPEAGELLAEYVLAMRHGLGVSKVLATVHSYPTLAEANRQAAGLWRRRHAPERLLRWAQRYHAWRRG